MKKKFDFKLSQKIDLPIAELFRESERPNENIKTKVDKGDCNSSL